MDCSILKKIFNILYENYGPQGWWPLLEYNGINPTKTGSLKGYHPGNYVLPETRKQKYEVVVGAILTQNTAWPNVEKALQNLKREFNLEPEMILKAKNEMLANAIRPAGFFNQKAQYLKALTSFILPYLDEGIPTRNALLEVKGVGKETADSILLYAFHQPVFVVDAYTKRLFKRFFGKSFSYEEIRTKVESCLKTYEKLNEFHALIVEHGKRFCGKKANCKTCILAKLCKKEVD